MVACSVLNLGPTSLFPDGILFDFVCSKMGPNDYVQIMDAVKFAVVPEALYAIGVLTAAADTKSIMVVNSVNAWVFGVLQILLIVSHWTMGPVYTWVSQSSFVVANIIIFRWRFFLGALAKSQHG